MTAIHHTSEKRLRRKHSPRKKPGESLLDLLLRRVSKSNSDCWEWTASKNLGGYGMIRISGKTPLAHRVSYSVFVGPIPEGMCVLHKCDNPPCVNPSHLFLGTKLDNAKDMARKNRKVNWESLKTQCIHGHPFSEENTRFYLTKTGPHRKCRECGRANALASYHRMMLKKRKAAK